MATPKKQHDEYRIVGKQPVGTCEHCNARGGYKWGGREYCARHVDEDVRVKTLMRKAATALRQALGPDYRIESLQVRDLSSGNLC